MHETILTHRGLLASWETLGKVSSNTDRLKNKYYSLGWTMMSPGETCFEFLFRATTVESIPKIFEEMDNNPVLKPGYRGVTVNVILADTSGNIGY